MMLYRIENQELDFLNWCCNLLSRKLTKNLKKKTKSFIQRFKFNNT